MLVVFLSFLLLVGFVSISDGCDWAIDNTGSLVDYQTIAAHVNDLDCVDGGHDDVVLHEGKFVVPSSMNFILEVHPYVNTEVYTSVPEMVIPYVENTTTGISTLRFQWNYMLPSVNVTAATIRAMVPWNVQNVETAGQDDATSKVDELEIIADFGDISTIVHENGATIRVHHGKDILEGEYPGYQLKPLTYESTGSSGSIRLQSFMPVKLDMSGSNETGQILLMFLDQTVTNRSVVFQDYAFF